MGMFDLLRGKKPENTARPRHSRPPPASTQFEASQMSPGSANSVRKDLLKVALRDMLMRNGIPQAWVSADMLRTSSPRREPGLHVRFLVRRWEPRLMLHGPALEQEFTNRLLMLDPQAADWLMGFSWQFALDDTTACPPLPHPGSWTAPHVATQPQGTAQSPVTKPGDIIEGPVVIPRSPDSVRAELEQMLAARDGDHKPQSQGGDHFAPTRPATL
jgi:hypothetical protein